MSEQPNEFRPSIKLVGNSDALGARFQPPLAESDLFEAMLQDCPIKSIDRNEDGTIVGITYEHKMYGAQESSIKTEFIASYATVAERLGRVLIGRGAPDQASAVLAAAPASPISQ